MNLTINVLQEHIDEAKRTESDPISVSLKNRWTRCQVRGDGIVIGGHFFYWTWKLREYYLDFIYGYQIKPQSFHINSNRHHRYSQVVCTIPDWAGDYPP